VVDLGLLKRTLEQQGGHHQPAKYLHSSMGRCLLRLEQPKGGLDLIGRDDPEILGRA
jgi:hypothetical protein